MMFPWKEGLQSILQGILYLYFEPVFLIILGLVAFLYWRMRKDQLKMFGVCGFSLRHQVLLSTLFGGLGGILASCLLVMLGVTLSQVGIGYIWPLAILLMMIDVRLMCFAYAGGIVATSHILFGWPVVNVPQVLCLIGVLHVTESFLIFISGRLGAQPMFLRQENGRLVGAFNLQNFWPLPLVLLAVMSVPESSSSVATIPTPDWWPLLTMGGAPAGQMWLYSMVPVVAALGYADVAISSTPQERRRRSACHLAIYSLVLLGLALLSAYYTWLQIFAALLAPLGHEFLIQRDNQREMAGTPRFVPPERGVMVLDAICGTTAAKMGLKPGDIILEMDGMEINNGFDLARAISFAPVNFVISICRQGHHKECQGSLEGGGRQLGIILVPVGNEQNFVRIVSRKYTIIDWFRRKLRREKH